ncbi:MAG TPA: HlyD family type I secretion periplasmic adaptor subunit [Gammaproteobacteria bacterium]|nr:HlyD family type I secretion periplasmic adaptor subunit [Gammaproteobacteria bacterium]
MTSLQRIPKSAEQRAFEQLQDLTAVNRQGLRFVDRVFKPLFSVFNNKAAHWETDAEFALKQQQVLKARGLLYVVALVFITLLVWAGFATVDEVTRGEGKVIPSRQLQVIQSVDGGVVEELFVQEGAYVKEGDVLVRIDPTRFIANFQENSVRTFALRAKVERLTALINEHTYQPDFATELTAQQLQVLKSEQNYYEGAKHEIEQRLGIAREQLSQRQQELSETQARIAAAQQAYRMSNQELQVTQPLLQSGAVSEVEILRLQRDTAAAQGELNQAAARARQIKASIQEAQGRIQEVQLSARNQWRAELSEASSSLNSLEKSVDGLADRVKFSEIRSPVDGTVQRVLFNTIGGVVQPGNAVLEIVPEGSELVIEGKIAPSDIAFLRPGLPVTIKFHAYDYAIYGGMSATLQHISADTITDERDNTYYLVRAVAHDPEFAKNLLIIPGMTTQVDVLTGKKTILSYLLKPVLRAKANALTER